MQSPYPQWTQEREFHEWDLKIHSFSKLSRWHVGTKACEPLFTLRVWIRKVAALRAG